VDAARAQASKDELERRLLEVRGEEGVYRGARGEDVGRSAMEAWAMVGRGPGEVECVKARRLMVGSGRGKAQHVFGPGLRVGSLAS